MAKECELLAGCGFFTKYQMARELGFIQLYCRGPKMNKCVRKIFRQKNGTSPTDDLTPCGQIIVKVKLKKEQMLFS